MKNKTVYISLGSNLGNREINIKKALNIIDSHKNIEIKKTSQIMETDPVDITNQPKFLNQVAVIETQLNPFELLKFFKAIETFINKKRKISKLPRSIDIDILLYGDLILNTERLTIPHKELRNRHFLLKLLLEIENKIKDPITQKPIKIYIEGEV